MLLACGNLWSSSSACWHRNEIAHTTNKIGPHQMALPTTAFAGVSTLSKQRVVEQCRIWQLASLWLLLGGRLWHIRWIDIFFICIEREENELFRRNIQWIYGLVMGFFIIQRLIFTVVGVSREYDLLRPVLTKEVKRIVGVLKREEKLLDKISRKKS